MADPTPTPNPEGSGAPQPDDKKTPEGNPAPTPAPEPKADDKKTFTQDDLNRLLAKEKRDWEKKLKDAEEKAKLTEDERLKADLEETKRQLAERDKRDAAVDAATAAGVKNTKLFYSAYGSELETDAKGKLTNLKEVLETAKAESPELFAPVPKGSADGGEGKTPSGLSVTREQFDKMTSTQKLEFSVKGGVING